MAFIKTRPGRKGVYVYFYDRSTGKLNQVDREKTKHLDDLPAHEQQAWLEAWEAEHGMAKERIKRTQLKPDEELAELWRAYQADQESNTRRRSQTSERETRDIFDAHILPYFVGEHRSKNPRKWHDLVPGFHEYLRTRYRDRTTQKTLWTLERFGEYLVWARQMTFPYSVRVPSTENTKITPLQVKLTPEQVLRFVDRHRESTSRALSPEQIDLMVLLAYFGGIGPNELFALDKADILAGESSRSNTPTQVHFRAAGLGTSISIRVCKTLPDSRDAKPVLLTKTDYRIAVVNIWHLEAAKRIAQIAKTLPSGRLFPISYGGAFQLWRREITPKLGVTPHDCRRASALYLGRTKRLAPTLLQEHMRHAEFETTLLYMREPERPDLPKKSIQDFSDFL